MSIKTRSAGLIIACSLFVAAGTSQAMCSPCYVQEGFTGIGWNTVPCDAAYPTAVTWQQYASGGYLPPARRGGFFRNGPFFWWPF